MAIGLDRQIQVDGPGATTKEPSQTRDPECRQPLGARRYGNDSDIGGADSMDGQSDLRASFGLANATNIDTVRIEWPCGTVQELQNVGTKQFLTVTEPARLNGRVLAGQYQIGTERRPGIHIRRASFPPT